MTDRTGLLALVVVVAATVLAATGTLTGGEWLSLIAGGAVALPVTVGRSSK